jgi:hypothetical protein
MFRCPHCARVYKLPLSKNYSLIANHDMNRFTVMNERVYEEGEKAKNLARQFLAFEHEALSLTDAYQYVQSMGEEIHPNDPISCPACHQEALLSTWKEAFESPIDFFDAEHLCGCGNELWMDRIPGTNKYGMVCDRCGWHKKDTIVSGSADVTVK